MKTQFIAFIGMASVALSFSSVVYAQDEANDFILSANVGFYSDYIFRGYTQTDNNPAIQGGFDVMHSSGLYLGNWSSNVSWATDGGIMQNNSIETNLFGGFKKTLANVEFDLGVLQYFYPGDDTANAVEANATEAYIGASKEFSKAVVTAYVYFVVSNDSWGISDTQGSQYYTLDLDLPVGETALTAGLHLGNQQFEGAGNAGHDYTDWKVNLDYALNDHYSAGAFYTGTDMDKPTWTVNGQFLGDDTFGAYLTAQF